MRNLKKILALVLALIMSLSLMATAGATDFKDDESIDTYQTAIEVLSGLKVFGGDQNGNFNPKDPIRRSEVAAIIYRIATGDVTNDHSASYGLYNQFKDVQDGDWFAGYVSYCHNAGYIKGHGDSTFAPYDNVTGYQALAMILRAVGYDKNNEFTGDNWQINTASIATQRGVLKGLQSTEDLKAPASRELVAEILFQSILIDKVQWNALTHSYDTTKEKVADVLSLEKITGVVIANEYAALDDTKPLAAGKTKLDVDGTGYTLDWAEDGYEASLDVIGQSRIAYVQKVPNKPYTVLNLADTGTNTVNVNNKDEKTGVKMKLADVAGSLTVNDTTEHYINFNPSTSPICDMRIEYELNFKNQDALNEFTRITGITQKKLNDTMGASKSTTNNDFEYGPVVIAANNKDANWKLTEDHLDIIEGIFTVADAKGSAGANKNAKNIDGSVYVGTRSETDLSDTMGYKKFDETYIEHPVTKITNVARGNDLRVIDNNGDGVAEYVLRIDYTLDRIVDAVTKNDSTTYYYNKLTDTVVLLNPDYERAVGDVVLYAVIDGKAYLHLAETATANFKSVSYKAETATDTDGKVWEQSEINNQSKLPGEIAAVSENAEYKLYLDNHGYIRAYDSKSNYALLTEVYHTNRQNQAWVTGTSLTAEATLAGGVATREYQVLNNYYLNTTGNFNPFYTTVAGGHAVTQPLNPTEENFLHAAAARLDITGCTGANAHAPFDWDATANVEKSWTNVAEYVMGENGINLFSASTTDGSREYIQLSNNNTSKNRALYQIYNNAKEYVRAVDDTVFFVVAKNGGNGQPIVREYVGWNNVPTLNNTNAIHAMYAVARDTRNQETSNVTGAYWVADVIVIEVEQLTSVFESVALVYSNDNKTTGRVKYLQALDNVKGEITIVPKNLNVWQGQYEGYGFYGLMDVEPVEGEANTYSANIRRITNTTNPTLGQYCDWSDVLTGGAHPANVCNDFNENGIYYGKVRSVNGELDRSRYITVDVLDWFGNIVDTDDIHLTANSGAYAINHKTSGTTEWNEAVSLVLNQSASNRVEIGDEILWVKVPGTTDSTVGFIVDLTDTGITGLNKPTTRSWATPDWLDALANDPTYYGTLSNRNGSIAWAQYDNGPQNMGTRTAAYNFEAVIDTRTPTGARIGQPYGHNFVVSNYELYVGATLLRPVFSGILSDGYWHVRYMVPTSVTVATDATVQVVNNTGANLWVNASLETGAPSWTVTIPATPAADVAKTVYVNTVSDTEEPLDDVNFADLTGKDVTIEKDPAINGEEPKPPVGDNEYAVTAKLTNVTSNAPAKVEKDAELKVQLTKAEGYKLPETVTVKMGGATLTAGTDYTYANGLITIAKVTGEVEITAAGVDDTTVNPPDPTEVLPYKVTKTASAYTLYKYQAKEMTNDELAAAIAKIETGVKAEDIKFIDAGDNIAVVANDKQLGTFAKTAQKTPTELFKVSLSDTVIAYVATADDKIEGFGSDVKFVVNSKNPTTTTADKDNAVAIVNGVATVTGIDADTTYLPAVKVVASGFATTGLKVADAYGNYSGTGINPGSAAYVVAGSNIQLTEGSVTRAKGLKVQLYKNNVAEGNLVTQETANTALTFTVENLTGGTDGVATFTVSVAYNVTLNGTKLEGVYKANDTIEIPANLGLTASDKLIAVTGGGEDPKVYSGTALSLTAIGDTLGYNLGANPTVNADGEVELRVAHSVTGIAGQSAIKVSFGGEDAGTIDITSAKYIAKGASLTLPADAQTYLVVKAGSEEVAKGEPGALKTEDLVFEVGDKDVTISKVDAPFTLALKTGDFKTDTTDWSIIKLDGSLVVADTNRIEIKKGDAVQSEGALAAGTYTVTLKYKAASTADLSHVEVIDDGTLGNTNNKISVSNVASSFADGVLTVTFTATLVS